MKIKIHLTLSKALFAVLSLFTLLALANPKEARADEKKEIYTSRISEYAEYSEYSGPNLSLYNNTEYKLIIDKSITLNNIRGLNDFSNAKLTIEGELEYTLTVNNCIDDLEKVVINSGNIKVINGKLGGTDILITGGNINCSSEQGSAIIARNKIEIKGGDITARGGGGSGIGSFNELLISGGNIVTQGDYGLKSTNKPITISGKNTNVSAIGTIAAIVCGYTGGGGINFKPYATVTSPEDWGIGIGSGIYLGNQYIFATTEGGSEPLYEVLIECFPPDPTLNSSQTSKRSYVKRDDDEDAVTEEYTKSAPVNKDALVITKMSGFPAGTFFAKQEQGIAAKNAFLGALPAGYKSAFTFNVITNGKTPDISLKKGSFTLLIPEEFRNPGRTFAILALDKSGKAILLTDTDTDPTTITVSLNLEGYAFDLIYKD